jgi:hypothetical protein
MSENETSNSSPDAVEPVAEANPDQSELAHSIIESLLEHTSVVSDLIALMAQALDPDTTKALTLTPQWQAYLESRRRMEQTRTDVEQFVAHLRQPE